MAKLRALPGGKGKGKTFSLIYGLRLYPAGEITQVTAGEVTGRQGETTRVPLHLIEGTREEIRAQLLASIDAFFEIYGEDLPAALKTPVAPRHREEGVSETGC